MALVPGPGLRARVHDPTRGRGAARCGDRRPRIRVPLRQPADRPARPRPEPAGRPVQRRSRRRGRDPAGAPPGSANGDRKSTRLNSSHSQISYAVFCLKKKKQTTQYTSMKVQYITLILTLSLTHGLWLRTDNATHDHPQIRTRIADDITLTLGQCLLTR